MSQAFVFWKDCWVYTKKHERETCKQIFKLVKERGSICISELIKELKGISSEPSIRNAYHYLLIGRIIRVEEHRNKTGRGSARILYLNKNAHKNQVKMLTSYKQYYKSESIIKNNV
jgi:hypothetical protein